jgi:two-component system, cell cycle sensor histidine kinase and response regulator CckA
MNTIRIRILGILLAHSILPLTMLLVGLYWLPAGFLTVICYGLLALLAVTLSLVISGLMIKPAVHLARAFDQMLRTNGEHCPKSIWVPAEFSRIQRSFSLFLKDRARTLETAQTDTNRARQCLMDANRLLQRSYGTLQSLFESSEDGILVQDNVGNVLSSNEALDAILGQPAEKIGTRNSVLLLAEIAGRFSNSTEIEKIIHQAGEDAKFEGSASGDSIGETPLHLSLITQPILSDSSEVVGRLWIVRDRTELRRLSEQLQQSQKMQAIGQLAGGIAHDFNNLLTAIRGNLALAEMASEDQPSTTRENLQGATRATLRAAELVKQLLGYSRKQALAPRPLDMGKTLTEVENILRHSLDPRITVECHPGENVWHAQANEVHIEQVILNMCLNARDALPETGGRIEISTENYHLDERRTPLPGPDVVATDFIMVRIKDNGSGIPEEKRDLIFDSFYSTKETGKGTGLGLSMAHSIMQEHGGWIEFDSETGKGTEFRLYLPRAEEELVPAKPVLDETSTLARPSASNESTSVLIVDDEQSVRVIAVTMLKYLGYQVTEASNGEEALEIVAAADSPFDAILLDIYMPKLSGRDTFKRLRADGCESPIIVCSGFVIDPDEFMALSEGGKGPVDIIQKPYSMATLASSVAKAVATSQPALVS